MTELPRRCLCFEVESSSLLSGKDSLDVERLMPFQAFPFLGLWAADI